MENSYLTERDDGKQMSFLIHFPIIPRKAIHCHSVSFHISIWSSLCLPVEGHPYCFPENSTTGMAEGKRFLLKCSIETKALLNTPQKNVIVLHGDTMHKSGWNTAGCSMSSMWNFLISYHGQNPVMFPLNTVFRQKGERRSAFHKHLDMPFSSCKMCSSVCFGSWLVFPNIVNSEINLATKLLYSKEIVKFIRRRETLMLCQIYFFSLF